MLNSQYPDQNCSIARTLELVGERWTLLIIRDLSRQPRRFNEIQANLDVARNVLTVRLERLITAGLVRRGAETPHYALTCAGRELFPALYALMLWGDKYSAPDGPPMLLVHEECGSPLIQQLTCPACQCGVHFGEFKSVPGPGAAAAESGGIPVTALSS